MISAGNQSSDSKIAHAYDQSIAQAQTDAKELEDDYEQRNGCLETPGLGAATCVDGVTMSAPDSLLWEDEGLRGHEFPIPAEAERSVAGKLVVNQDTLPKDESRRGGLPGQVPGDIQPASAVPSILDQDAVAPDLASEQG